MASVADPTAVWARLDYLRQIHPNLLFHEVADKIAWESLRPYDASDSIASETHKRYHDELQERARAGDRYAKSMLLGHAYQEPADAS